MKKYAVLILLLAFILFKSQGQQTPKEPPGKFVTVNGHRIWYLAFGKGAPLLFIAGGPGLAHYFWPDMNQFSDSFQVIYFDAFGRGASDRAKDPSEYSFQHDVDEVEGLRVALGLGKINVYGHSYGGIVAQGYALKYPNSISHLILANTIYSAEMWQKGNNDTWNDQIQKQLPELAQQLDSLRQKGYLSTDSAYQAIEGKMPIGMFYYYNPENARDSLYSSPPNAFNLEVYKRIAGPDADVIIGGDIANLDFRSRLKEIKVPVLILAGRYDRVAIPKYALQFKTFMPQAKFVMFEKSGHLPYREEPSLHAKILRDFLNNRYH